MRRLITSRLYTPCSLLYLCLLLFGNTTFADLDLPDEMSIQIKHQTIKGWRKDPERLKEIALELTDPNLEEVHKPILPEEGFVYYEAQGIKELFNLSAWSSQGREKDILKEARAELERVIQSKRIAENQEPGGYIYYGESQKNFGKKRQPAKVFDTRTEAQKIAMKKNVLIQNNVQLASVASIEPEKLVAEEVKSMGKIWILVVSIILLAVSCISRKLIN